MLNDGQARRIAADWYGPRETGLVALATSGAITPETTTDIERTMRGMSAVESRELRALLAYVKAKGLRGPVAGWPHMQFDYSPVRLADTQ